MFQMRNLHSQPRLSGVDALRGLCVLLVVLHHIHLRFVLNHYDVDHSVPVVLNRILFWSGYYAVIVFFVISGFLITGLSIRRWGSLDQIHIGRFYRMRAARILPCLVLVLSLLTLLYWLGAQDFIFKPGRPSLGRALLAALTFHLNWLEGHYGYLPGNWDVLWSLSVEEAFYLFFPLACLLFRSERLLLFPLLCLIVIGPFNRAVLADQDPWNQYAYLSCSDGIAFGCIAALLSARAHLSTKVLRALLLSGAVIAALTIALCDEDGYSGLARFGLNVTALEVGTAMMLVALGKGVGNEGITRGTGWLRLVGRGSYEIYLFHMFVIFVLMDLFWLLLPSLKTLPLWYGSMLLISVVLGSAVAAWYSEPLNRRFRSNLTYSRNS